MSTFVPPTDRPAKLGEVRAQLTAAAGRRWENAHTVEMVLSLRTLAEATSNIERCAMLTATADRLEHLYRRMSIAANAIAADAGAAEERPVSTRLGIDLEQEMLDDRVEDDAAELGHVITRPHSHAAGYCCSCGHRASDSYMHHLVAVVEAHLVAGGHEHGHDPTEGYGGANARRVTG